MSDRELLLLILKMLTQLSELQGPFHTSHPMYALIQQAKQVLRDQR